MSRRIFPWGIEQSHRWRSQSVPEGGEGLFHPFLPLLAIERIETEAIFLIRLLEKSATPMNRTEKS